MRIWSAIATLTRGMEGDASMASNDDLRDWNGFFKERRDLTRISSWKELN